MVSQGMTDILVAVVLMVSTCWTPIALADQRICTKDESQSAEAIAATAVSWRQLHQKFEQYSHCDDGAIAEGFSESVSLLLADRWADIRQLDVIARSQSAFQEFVVRHIDETVPKDRLERIGINAREQCPQGIEDLCRQIKSRVGQVLPGVL